MRVIGIVCSGRRHGNTEIMVNEALSGARCEGAETELISLSGKNIEHCDGCYSCKKTGRCCKNDFMQHIYKKMLDADGIIIGTPTYFWSMSGIAKNLVDRTLALRYPFLKLANKVGGAIAVAGRCGASSALTIFSYYFSSNHMFPAELIEGYGFKKGEITKDMRGMKAAYEMGRQVVCLLKLRLKFSDNLERATPIDGLTDFQAHL